MDAVWICLMVSKSLDYKDSKAIEKELSLMFGEDLIDYKVGCNDDLTQSGEYYLFVRCYNYWSHSEAVLKNHFVTSVVPSHDNPHNFSPKEITSFLSSIGHKEQQNSQLENGDVVLIKNGYLKGLYGIVTKMLSAKKYRIFFSFYVRQFSENFSVTDIEFIGKVSGYQFPAEDISKPIIIGAHIVHHRKLYRAEGRNHKVHKGR